MSLGIYISVPFCQSKCSYCNFASGVFSRAKYQAYVDRVCGDIAQIETMAAHQHAHIPSREVDSIYLGGGTPTILESRQLEQLFAALRQNFEISSASEVTVECAPGTLNAEIIEALVHCGVNRVSLGVQSFVDAEARAVGRLHTRKIVLADIARLRAAGIASLNIDLIAGLPHQTAASWQASLDDAITCAASHVSVYMLEVDEDSRLGNELIAGGKRYHAHAVPDDELTAGFYVRACQRLNAAGVQQYEISNFANASNESRHNLKYWTRQPYLGFGVDAHSMLPPNAALAAAGVNAVRFSMPAELEDFVAGDERSVAAQIVTERNAVEETFFLGLRLNSGVFLPRIEASLDDMQRAFLGEEIAELGDLGLLSEEDGWLRLTERGRLLSNEVFQKFVSIGSKDEMIQACR